MNPFSTFFDNNPMSQNTPETQAILFKSLVDFIEASKDIHADSTNPFHRNRYDSLSAHLLALKPLAAKHGLAIIQMPIGDSESVGVRTLVIHACGAYLSADALIPAEKGLKGQDAGALISYLRRYALASVSGVATEDDDAETDRVSKAGSTVSLENPPKGMKYIPNPNAGKSVKASGAMVAPFGDRKGIPLAELPKKEDDRSVKCGDLYYFAKVWTPKPFGESTTVSPKDLAIKAEAIRLFEGEAPQTADEVPF